MFDPRSLLLPYQRTMLDLIHRNKLCHFICARQIGKSFTIGYAAVEHCWTKPNAKVVILSSGERSALEVLDKCKQLVKVFKVTFNDTPADLQVEMTASEIRFSNGSKIIILPSGDPDKARGYSPSLTICDEFSTQQDQDAFYAAIFPFVTSPFGGEKKLIIVGTPLGTQNLFWRLWTEKNDFAKFSVDIYQARSMGLNVDIDLLKKNIPDEDTFAQEYLCKPMDSISNLFTYDLLNQVTYAVKPSSPVIVRYGGMDVGRHNDLTAITILALCQDGRTFVEEIKVLRNTEFREQMVEASNIIKALGIRRICIDSSGLGMQLAEDLQREFGAIVEPVNFTNAVKTDMLNGLKKAFGDRTCLIPNEPELLREFGSIKRVITANTISYQADRNANGHADRAISIALAHKAYLNDNNSMDFVPISF